MNRSGSNPNMFSSSFSSIPFSNPTLNNASNPYKLNRAKRPFQQVIQQPKSSNNPSLQSLSDNFAPNSPTFKPFTSTLIQKPKDLTDSNNQSKSPESSLIITGSQTNYSIGDKKFKRQGSFNPYKPLQGHIVALKSGMTQIQVKQQEIRYYKRLHEKQLLEEEQNSRTLSKINQQKQAALQNVSTLTAKLGRANQNYEALLLNNQKLIERLKQEHKRQIIEINERSLQRMNSKDQILTQQLRKVRQQNLSEMQGLRQHYESLLDKANLQFQALRNQSLLEIEKMNEEHTRNMDELNLKNLNQMHLLLNQKQKEHNHRLLQIEKQNRQRIISLNKVTDETKEELNKTINLKQKMRNEYEQQIMSMKSEFLKESQMSKNDAEQFMTRLSNQNRQQLDHLKAQLDKVQNQLKQREEHIRDIQYEIQRYKQKQFDLIKQKESMLNKFEENKANKDLIHQQAIEQLKRDHLKHIQTLLRQHKNLIDNMTKNQQVQRMKIQYQHQLQRATVTLTHQLQEVNKRLLESKNENFETLVQVKNQHSSQLLRVQNYYKSQIVTLKRQHEEGYSKWKYDFEAAINDFTKQCQKMERDHQKQLQEVIQNSKKSTDKVSEQKSRQIGSLKKQLEQAKSQFNKVYVDLESAHSQIIQKKTQLMDQKAQFDKINAVNARKVTELEQIIKNLKNNQSKNEEQIHQLQIKILNDKKAYQLQLESMISKTQQLRKQILFLQAKKGEKPNDEQISSLKKRWEQQRQDFEKKHYRQVQCLNQKIEMLNQVINKKQQLLRKEREQHNQTIEGLFHNSSKKKQQRTFEIKAQDLIKTSVQGLASEELIKKVRELQRQKQSQNEEIRTLEATNKKLREQLMSNLSTFDKQKELYQEISMLKAKLKGYQQYKKLSKIQSESSLNIASSLSFNNQRDSKDHNYKKQMARRNNLQDQDQFGVPYFKESYKKDDYLSSSVNSNMKKSRAEQRVTNKDYMLNSYQTKNHDREFQDFQKPRSPQRNSALSNKISPSKSRLNRVLFKTQVNQYHTEKKNTQGNYSSKYLGSSTVYSPNSQLNISDQNQRKYYRK